MNQMKFVNRESINKGWLSDRKYWAILFGQDEVNTMLNQYDTEFATILVAQKDR